MAKRAFASYFLPPPSREEVQACVDEWRLKSALHPPAARRSRLAPCIPVIATLLNVEGASLQKISNTLWTRHKVKVHKSTLCRFIQMHPLLRHIKEQS